MTDGTLLPWRDTPGRETYQLLTWGCGQPYCPYQSAA